MKSAKKRKEYEDDEYKDVEEIAQPTKKRKKKEKFLNFVRMDKHAKKIWNMDKNGSSASEIAAALCLDNNLPVDSITGKQVSNWMDYKKRSKSGKPRQVSIENNNLRAEYIDDCMYLN
jgi:hypothetical protein